MRLTVDQRHLLVDALSRGVNKCEVARVFGVARSTVYRWWKRQRQYTRSPLQDRPRKPRKAKITERIELSILALRNTFHWGTARIQQGLRNLPPFMRVAVPSVAQHVLLSRTAINNVLRKHKINGYDRQQESWKFFRTSKPNELWQLDIKGPFIVQGRKHFFLVVVDDYSRYLVVFHHALHAFSSEDVAAIVSHVLPYRRPQSILTDNNPFKKEWDAWCRARGITPLHAHPYYPQDKGKVERAIRNVAEEFVYLTKPFPRWLAHIKSYQRWYNTQRFHRGIQAIPVELYVCSVSKCT